MPETAAEIGRGAHLPEQPGEAFRALRGVFGKEGAELLREIEQDRAGLENPRRLRQRIVHQRRNFRIRVDRHEAGAELVAVADPDEPGVVFGAAVACRQQLLQHHRDLHAVGRAQRVELQRVPAARQLLLVRGAGDGAVDRREAAAALALPGPDFRRFVGGGVGHIVVLQAGIVCAGKPEANGLPPPDADCMRSLSRRRLFRAGPPFVAPALSRGPSMARHAAAAGGRRVEPPRLRENQGWPPAQGRGDGCASESGPSHRVMECHIYSCFVIVVAAEGFLSGGEGGGRDRTWAAAPSFGSCSSPAQARHRSDPLSRAFACGRGRVLARLIARARGRHRAHFACRLNRGRSAPDRRGRDAVHGHRFPRTHHSTFSENASHTEKYYIIFTNNFLHPFVTPASEPG